MTRFGSRAGFTLLELMIASVLAIGLAGLALRAVGSSAKLSGTTLVVGRLQEIASQVGLRVASELRWADPGSLILSSFNGADRVDFRVAEGWDGTNTLWSSQIACFYQPVGEDTDGDGVANEGVLLREQDGTERVLCRNVRAGSLTFVRAAENVDVSFRVFDRDAEGQLIERDAATSVTLLNRWVP
jgi:type II secretory pathway pseudopilin PulG